MLTLKGLQVSTLVIRVHLPDFASYKVARDLYRRQPAVQSLLIKGRRRSVGYLCGNSKMAETLNWNLET